MKMNLIFAFAFLLVIAGALAKPVSRDFIIVGDHNKIETEYVGDIFDKDPEIQKLQEKESGNDICAVQYRLVKPSKIQVGGDWYHVSNDKKSVDEHFVEVSCVSTQPKAAYKDTLCGKKVVCAQRFAIRHVKIEGKQATQTVLYRSSCVPMFENIKS